MSERNNSSSLGVSFNGRLCPVAFQRPFPRWNNVWRILLVFTTASRTDTDTLFIRLQQHHRRDRRKHMMQNKFFGCTERWVSGFRGKRIRICRISSLFPDGNKNVNVFPVPPSRDFVMESFFGVTVKMHADDKLQHLNANFSSGVAISRIIALRTIQSGCQVSITGRTNRIQLKIMKLNHHWAYGRWSLLPSVV